MSAIFLLPVCLIYWPRKYTPSVDPTSIIPTRFEVDMTINCRVMAFLSADTSRDLDHWPFDLEQMSYMASHVTNLATKYEHPTPIRSLVMSYNVSRWLPLKVRTRPLRMRRITWPVSRRSKTITFWDASSRITYSLCNFGGSTMKVIKVICKNNPRICVSVVSAACALCVLLSAVPFRSTRADRRVRARHGISVADSYDIYS